MAQDTSSAPVPAPPAGSDNKSAPKLPIPTAVLVILILHLVFALVRVGVSLVQCAGFIQIANSGGSSERAVYNPMTQTTDFVRVSHQRAPDADTIQLLLALAACTGLLQVVVSVLADTLLLMRKKTGIIIGYVAVALIVLSMLVGVWDIYLGIERMTTKGADSTVSIVGAGIGLLLRVVFVWLYFDALQQLRRLWSDNAGDPPAQTAATPTEGVTSQG